VRIAAVSPRSPGYTELRLALPGRLFLASARPTDSHAGQRLREGVELIAPEFEPVESCCVVITLADFNVLVAARSTTVSGIKTRR
jgi:hypothetical protein